MSTPPAQKNQPSGPETNKATLGAFFLSIIIHGTALLLVGGYVIFEGVIPKTPFQEVNVPVDVNSDEVVMPEIEESTELAEVPALTNDLAPSVSSEVPQTSTSADILVSTGTNPAFTLPPAVGAPSSIPKLGGGAVGGAEIKNTDQARTSPSSVRTLSSLFGSRGESSDALVGNFYDLKQTPDKKDTGMGFNPKDDKEENKKNLSYNTVLNDFVKNWDEKVLQGYYKARGTLSTTQIFIPAMSAVEAPKAFDVEKEVAPRRWVIHYRGNFTAPKSGTFRFVGFGDDVLVVRFNSNVVFAGCIAKPSVLAAVKHDRIGTLPMLGMSQGMFAGPWFSISEGQTYPMEVLVGEIPGGLLGMILLIQEQGVDYPQRANNAGPVLPVFQTVPTRLPKYAVEKQGPKVADTPFSGR